MRPDMLTERARLMGIALSAEAAERICEYHGMLTRKNREMNLTRVPDDPEEAMDRNYLDSLSVLSADGAAEAAETAIDVGSGAGFPGLVLACARSGTHMILIDAQRKRVEFLNEVIRALRLNAEALHLRAEDAGRGRLRESADLVTARAVADLRVLAEWTLPLAKVGGRVVLWKGPTIRQEIEDAGGALAALGGGAPRVLPVEFPGRDWQHRLLILDKVTPTPAALPRRAGIAQKRPLK